MKVKSPIILKSKKVALVIAYSFPPVFSLTGTRAFKLCKYLKKNYDWKPIILSIERSLRHPFDQSLHKELEESGIEVIRVNAPGLSINLSYDFWSNPSSLIRLLFKTSNFDTKLRKKIVKEASHIISKKPNFVDLLYCFSPPWLSYLAALELQQMHTIPLVLDFYAPWIDHPNKILPMIINKWTYQKEEAKSIQLADAIVTTNRYTKELLIKKYFETLPREKIAIVENGFDDSDIEKIEVRPQDITYSKNTFHLIHVGEVTGDLCCKTLFRGVKYAIDKKNIPLDKIKLDFIGYVNPTYLRYAKSIGLSSTIIHREITSYQDINRICLREGSAFLILESSHEWGRSTSIPKFQYLVGFKKPIFKVGTTDCNYFSTLINQTGGALANCESDKDISDKLSILYQKWSENSTTFNNNILEKYEFKNLASVLSSTLSKNLHLNF